MADDFDYDDDITDDFAEKSPGDYLNEQFADYDWARDFDFNSIDPADAETAADILDNIFGSGYYPDSDTIDRLVELTDMDYDGWSEYFDDQDVDWETYEPA